METGQIVAEGVSRRFRVNPHRNLTLKEAILRPETRRTEEIWALKNVSFDVEPGPRSGSSAATARGRRRSCG